MLSTINFTSTSAYKELLSDQIRLESTTIAQLFKDDSARQTTYTKTFNGIFFDFSKNLIDEGCFQNLLKLAKECGLDHAIKAQFTGDKINQTEGRSVLHTALRAKASASVLVDGENIIPKIQAVKTQMKEFSDKVISGTWKGFSAKEITDVVNIGIGGSDLGPVMVTEALKPYKHA